MTDPFRDSIVEAMSMKETDELVKIWQVHDPEEWTETAYEVISEILQERLGEIPQITGVVEEEGEDEVDEGDIPELDDDNFPEFYDPGKVVKLEKWIDYATIVAIASSVVVSVTQVEDFYNLIRSYFYLQPGTGFLVIVITAILFLAALAFEVAIIYFPFKALKYILQMLMEMEFNSR